MALLLAGAASLLLSFSTRSAVDDVWKALGISQQSGTEGIKNSFLNGYLYSYGAKNAKNIALNDRAAIAKDLLAYTKQYITGSEFKKQYEQLRKNSQPVEPVLKPVRTIQEIQKEEIAKTEKGIKDTEKTLKEVSPDIAKSIRPVLEMQQKNLKDYQDASNPLFGYIQQGEKMQQENESKTYKENKERWQKEFPENINLFITDKLQKMLDYTKDIDYNAQLVEKYGKKRFVNPAYEGKRSEWKQGFRAGKDVTETARAFARQWLTELK